MPSERVEDDLPTHLQSPLIQALAARLFAQAAKRREERRRLDGEEPKARRRSPGRPSHTPEPGRDALTGESIRLSDLLADEHKPERERRPNQGW